MYYVPDGTTKCGFYECKCCRSRFMSLQTMKKIPCPYFEQDSDMEIQEIVEGENVEKMDRLLSLAITGGDYEWL